MARGDIMSHKYKLKIITGGAEKMAHAIAIKGNSNATMHSAHVGTRDQSEDRLMVNLSECGKRLNERLEISDEHIERALKEIRRECWK